MYTLKCKQHTFILVHIFRSVTTRIDVWQHNTKYIYKMWETRGRNYTQHHSALVCDHVREACFASTDDDEYMNVRYTLCICVCKGACKV